MFQIFPFSCLVPIGLKEISQAVNSQAASPHTGIYRRYAPPSVQSMAYNAIRVSSIGRDALLVSQCRGLTDFVVIDQKTTYASDNDIRTRPVLCQHFLARMKMLILRIKH